MRLLGEGGFAKTYEVSNRTGIPKVLKVLTKNQSKAVEQFQREAQVLTRLNHSGIPQGEEYFTFFPQNSQEPVHCLVMEKIEGENLQEWLKNRGDRPISERQAVDWLTQLANTLHEVHQQQLIHRDIKPSNIMLKPDGQLVLIDFGIAREITETYEQKLAAGQVTATHTYGYAPLEQVIGRAVPQSDFFALGRTFVYLLTGKHPDEIGNNYRDPNTDDDWNWREAALKVSDLLADFIDKLMARPIQERPADTQAILQRLAEIEETLYPPRQPQPNLSNLQAAINWQNLTLERTLGDLSACHSASVNSLAISADGQILVTGSTDKTLKAWNLVTGEEIHTFSGHSDSVLSVAISPDGKILASAGADGMIGVWNLKTRQLIQFLGGHSGQVMSVVFHPKNNKLFSGSGDKTIKVWDKVWELINKPATHTHAKHSSGVTSIALSSDGQTLVSGSYDKTIIVWSAHIIPGHSDVIWSVAISPDGQMIVSGGRDKEIKVWNLSSGELLHTLTGHSASVLSVAISPTGETLFSGSEDKTVKVWSLSTGQEIRTLTKYIDAVTSLAISPDGQALVSGSRDGTIKVWRVQ